MELHVVFNYSAAGTLRQALAGRAATVARFSDNLSYGPINPMDSAIRRAWVAEEIGFDNPDITGDEETFWPKIIDKAVSRVAWVSRRSAKEYCGFLEYLRRLGDLPTHVIDTTDAQDEDGAFFRGVGSIPGGGIQALNLPAALNVEARDTYLDLWGLLRAENGMLRTVDQNLALQSSPMSFYDEKLLSLTSRDWKPMSRILADMAVLPAAGDELFLCARMHELEEAGFLTMRDSGKPLPDVRLAHT